MKQSTTIERWVNLRVELLVDGVVVADSPKFGVLPTTQRDGTIALPVDTLDRTLIAPARCPDQGTHPFEVSIGKRRIPGAGVHLPNETAILNTHTFDECWIDGRLMPRPAAPTEQ